MYTGGYIFPGHSVHNFETHISLYRDGETDVGGLGEFSDSYYQPINGLFRTAAKGWIDTVRYNKIIE